MILNKVNLPELASSEEEISLEVQSQIIEGYMQDTLSHDEIMEFISDHDEVFESVRNEIVTEKTIVRFDKAARLSKAKEIAIFTIAKEKKNPLFRKLLSLWRAERFIKARLSKLYGNEATRRARKAISTASKKPTKTMKKVLDRVAIRAKRDINALKDSHARQVVTKITN